MAVGRPLAVGCATAFLFSLDFSFLKRDLF